MEADCTTVFDDEFLSSLAKCGVLVLFLFYAVAEVLEIPGILWEVLAW